MRLLARAITVFGILAAGCAGPVGDDGVSDPESSADEVVGGKETFEHPEVGMVWKGGGLCTGTLIRPNVVLTAAHCVTGSPKDEDVSTVQPSYAFEIRASAEVKQRFAVDRAYAVPSAADFDGSQSWRKKDIALLRLATPVPATLAKPLRAAPSWPWPGARVALYGYGCTDRATGENGRRPGTGVKRKLERNWTVGLALGWTETQNVCQGDSGGPLLDLNRGVVLGTNSGYVNEDDRFGDVPASYWVVESIANKWSR